MVFCMLSTMFHLSLPPSHRVKLRNCSVVYLASAAGDTVMCLQRLAWHTCSWRTIENDPLRGFYSHFLIILRMGKRKLHRFLKRRNIW